MTIANVLGMSGIVGIAALVVVGVLWFTLTVCILCIMEVRRVLRLNEIGGAIAIDHLITDSRLLQGLSAFLHALRLHWVEANSKHYEAGGYVRPIFFPIVHE